jgi:hypothetical protein
MLPSGSSDQPGDWPGVHMSLYLVLLRTGFSQPTGHPAAGELLPHHFTLAPTKSGRYVSVALSIGLPLLGVTQRPARRSSDFPPRCKSGRSPGLLDPHLHYITASILSILVVFATELLPLLCVKMLSNLAAAACCNPGET